MISHIYSSLAKAQSNGIVTVGRIVRELCVDNHPSVISARVSGDDVLQGMIFDMLGEEAYEQYCHYSNCLAFEVTSESFNRHYEALSSVTNRDEYFELLLRSTWGAHAGGMSRRLQGLDRGSSYLKRLDTASFESVMKSSMEKKAIKKK